MLRRADLALALVNEPRVLFLDEPTGLDPASRRTIWREVERLRDAGVTILLTTQYLEEADALADRIAIIDGGQIAAAGTPGELKRSLGGDVVEIELEGAEQAHRAARLLDGGQPDGERVRFTVDDGPTAVPRVLERLGAEGLASRSLTVSEPDLDDVFLQVTGHRLEGAARQPRPEQAA